MVTTSKVEEVTHLLKNLVTSSSVEACAVITVDGFMIASVLPRDVETDRVAALSAAIVLLGKQTATELARGELSEVYIKGKDGYVVSIAAGESAVLTAMARKDAKLGLVFLDMKRTAEEVAKRI